MNIRRVLWELQKIGLCKLRKVAVRNGYENGFPAQILRRILKNGSYLKRTMTSIRTFFLIWLW
ncbi:hypothetical protein ASA97_24960, partial [Salmonella enterica subsp. enterica serovar Typhimurium var. 5-]|nr:hypothetical protein [Salmonella enterica subsp. enterica serovar Typhimurium var. 5-]